MSERLSPNFTRAEFACKCGCGFAEPDPALVTGLQALRDALGKPIIITSGCRCAKHNTAEGGAKRSMHVAGKAADIRVARMT
ncbi:MAG: D-Ala-D-Ala carboxypeptidase family metallohydrolase, partial [Sulfuricella sp.]